MGRNSFAALLGMAVFACAPLPPPESAPPPPPEEAPRGVLLDEAEITALAELLQAEDRRQLDPARIAELLRHPSVEVRQRAALAAGRVGDLRTSSLLVRAIDDSVRSVGANAVFALGLLSDTSSTLVYTLGRHLGVSWTEDDERGVEAVAALGRMGTPEAYAALRQVLQRYVTAAGTAGNGGTVRPIGEVGKEALLAIWRFPRPEASLDLIIPHLATPDDDVRWRAAHALARIESPRTVGLLRERLADPDPLVRALAARGLRPAAADSAGQRGETLTALTTALGDDHPHVRINALGSLAAFADSTLTMTLAAVLDDEDGNVVMAAVQALGSAGGTRAATALAGIARDAERPIAVRAAALAGLVRTDRRMGMADVNSWASSENWLARLYAVRSLVGVAWDEAGRPLRQLAADRDGRVAAAALRAATAATDTINAPYTLYMQALAASDASVRAAAAAGLGRRASPADLAALMQAYERAQRDTVRHAAIAAVEALAALERRGVPVRRSFFLRFPPSADTTVRARVAAHFGSDGWGEEPPHPARRLAFYQDVVRELVAPVLAGEAPPVATISTAAGRITIELAAAWAPLTTHNFITLATNGYYPDGLDDAQPRFRWHRVVPNFVLQDGDPRGDGSGGPGYAIRDEINRLRYRRGAVGMALSGPDTGGSQFFITHSPQPHLDGGYTVFGRVVAGMEVADRVVQDDPIYSIVISR